MTPEEAYKQIQWELATMDVANDEAEKALKELDANSAEHWIETQRACRRRIFAICREQVHAAPLEKAAFFLALLQVEQ